MYYEIHGTGHPLILVHGGLGSSDTLGQIVPELSKSRQIIAVDLQGHGRTGDIDRPMSYEAMADDVAALIQYLGFEKPDVMLTRLGAKSLFVPPSNIHGNKKTDNCLGHVSAR